MAIFQYNVETNTGSATGSLEAISEDAARDILKEQYEIVHKSLKSPEDHTIVETPVKIESLILTEVGNG